MQAPPSVAPAARTESLAVTPGVSIAYCRTAGKPPGIVFLHGFMSDMGGAKALALDAWARREGRAYLRFDQTGHGASSGRIEDGTVGAWRDDTLAALDRLTDGPQIVVGSSLGGWLALLATLARPARVAGLVLVAPAPDFTEDLIWAGLGEAARAKLVRDGVFHQPSSYGERPYPITMKLIEDGRRNLLLRGPIPIVCGVRILHGMADLDVPWRRSLDLAARLESQDVRVALIKDGDHRLSRERDMKLLCDTVGDLAR